jgi:trigger factor
MRAKRWPESRRVRDDQATAVEAPGETVIDDEFAKSLGLESLDKLKEAARERLKAEFAGAIRQRVKRALLDRLDESHKFEAPPSLVAEEFNLMWNSIKAEMESSGKTFADENTTEEAAKEEYQKIADRRVRLGLVLSEIGEKNKITVSDDEVSRAVIERARSMPGPREGSLGLLSQQRQCARPASCTDL